MRLGQTLQAPFLGRPSIQAQRIPVRPAMPKHGSYIRRSPLGCACKTKGLSGLGQITGNPTIDAVIENPFVLGAGTVMGFLVLQNLFSRGKKAKRKVSSSTLGDALPWLVIGGGAIAIAAVGTGYWAGSNQ